MFSQFAPNSGAFLCLSFGVKELLLPTGRMYVVI